VGALANTAGTGAPRLHPFRTRAGSCAAGAWRRGRMSRLMAHLRRAISAGMDPVMAPSGCSHR